MSVAANPDFRKLWAAQAVSGFGARITREGLPMMAVIGLAASPGQLGVLAALSTALLAADLKLITAVFVFFALVAFNIGSTFGMEDIVEGISVIFFINCLPPAIIWFAPRTGGFSP